MRKQALRLSIMSTTLVSVLVLALAAKGAQPTGSTEPQATPNPTRALHTHVPYDPFINLNMLPEYPLSNLHFPEGQLIALLIKPTGIDLDVTYINRTPMYNRYDVWYTEEGKPYLHPGTENDKRWPAQGEVVTFTAHVINKGTLQSGSFAFKWYIDGSEVQAGTLPSLNPGEEGTTSYQWAWAHTLNGEQLLGTHTVRFTVDPTNAISETYESNNSLEDRTEALSLLLALTPDLYNALEVPINSIFPFSAEDWLQKQIAAMNAAFIRSVYSSAPSGITERVRLDKILITSTEPPAQFADDGQFFMADDGRYGSDAYYDPVTDVSGSLIHELTHQFGIIDMYNLDVPLEIPQVLDRLGRPVQMEYSTYFLFPGLMNNPGIKPPIYDEHTTLALNDNKGYRRGYYGEYLYDVPEQTRLRIMDNKGNATSGVTVKLYQRSFDQGLYGSRFGTIDNVSEVTGVTDNNGLVILANRSVGTPTTTNTGHTLHDNPFAIIDVVGYNDEFLMELTKDNHQEFRWLDITEFNLTAWQGNDTIEIYSHVPPDNAPAASISLDGNLESGLVKLEWSPSSFDSIVSYNVYRANSPAYYYQQIVTNTTVLSYTELYDYNSRAVVYAVTAVDDQGQKGGFSNFFYALRLINPAAIAIEGGNRRIVLDPQNGYALLYQLPDGTFLDTRSSLDYHLEFSYYMVHDWQSHHIISHPGDYYTTRHSIRIFDQDYNLISEFGDTGTGLGQFNDPAGVAIWPQTSCNTSCRFLISDSGNNRIQAFDANGNFISTYGTSGSGNGQFNNPQGIIVDINGDVIVVDSDNNRLQVFNFNGSNFTFSKSIISDFNHPTGITVYGTDYIIIADTGNNKIKLLTRDGSLIAEYNSPNDGHLGNFNQPRGVAADHAGNIIIADTGNKRVVTILDVLPAWITYLPVVINKP